MRANIRGLNRIRIMHCQWWWRELRLAGIPNWMCLNPKRALAHISVNIRLALREEPLLGLKQMWEEAATSSALDGGAGNAVQSRTRRDEESVLGWARWAERVASGSTSRDTGGVAGTQTKKILGFGWTAPDDWIEEERDCIQSHRLEGESAASRLGSYLHGAARSEILCRSIDVRKDADQTIAALGCMYGEKETANQVLWRFFFRRQMAGEPIIAYSHGLIEIANRINHLVPKTDEERNMMLRDKFVENVRDTHLCWELFNINIAILSYM